MQAYSNPKRENDPRALPDLEVFWIRDAAERRTANHAQYSWTDNYGDGWGEDGETLEQGWYYWSCFPGCLPDSDPIGPFETQEAALADAREGLNDDDEEATS